jgi:CNT family concentrative nucleoside transporter
MRASARLALVVTALLFASAVAHADDGPESGAPVGASVVDGGENTGAASADGGVAVVAPATPSDAPVAPETKTFAETRQNQASQNLAARAMGLVGCLVLFLIAIALSTDRRQISWRIVVIGTFLQVFFAVIVLKTRAGEAFFRLATTAVNRLLSFSVDGARFVFGNLVEGSVPVTSSSGGAVEYVANTGAFIAFGVLPSILFFSALTALFYHLGILQFVVGKMAWAMRRTMGTSGAESLSAAANIFVGQTEAPLLVRPYLEKMTKSELMAIMSGGFATVAGGVMAVYVGMLRDTFPDIAGHLLAASVMSAPASLVMAKIIVPETSIPETRDGADMSRAPGDEAHANFLDAITRGTSDGLQLCLNVGAMLISFVAIIALVNFGIGAVGGLFGAESLSLQTIFGYVLAPLAFVLGVPWDDAQLVGGLMGTKTVVNEFVAFLDLKTALDTGTITSTKSVVIATYALAGFSNFGSIGIQIGGLAVIAPSRRAELARLGVRAMIAGSLACFQTAAIAGMLL